jgi:hypothetical protein
MKPDSTSQRDAPGESLAGLLAQARDRFRTGDPEGAKALCARVLDEGWQVREVYLLLADIYRFEGEKDKAEATLKMAAEAPRAPASPGAVGGKGTAGRRIWVAPPLPVYWLVAAGGLALAVVAAVGIGWAPARFQWFGVNPVQMLLVAAAGFLAVGSLAASGLIRTFDQELTELGPGDELPLWLWLLVAGVFSAWLAAFLLGWAAYLRGEDARTTVLVLGTMVFFGAIIGVALGGGGIFWWLGLNVLWEGGLLGWALGSIASPREWWQV